MEMNVHDAVIVVTGGTSTLGEAICRAFLHEGAYVWCGWTSPHGKKRALTLAEEVGSRLLPLRIDVRDGASVTAARDAVMKEHGYLDVLVNNAGVFTVSSQEDLAEQDWDTVFDTNITGVWRMVKTFLPVLADGGSIVNISSMNASRPGFGGTAHYDASKGAVSSYTASLAAEVGPRIRVNAVAPGLIDAPYLHEGDSSLAQSYVRRAALGRLVQASEAADMVLFLASERARAVTGQIFGVDCGYPLG
ncbi:SDR family NAD(P)-dependent oxidoreductase [Parasphaerochaeta coccoides]|uniref:3-oxoacyl-(Acyl-carrier-protein) reductase n=1 Tax=Parasphaerochaeta coccoides (strain ATCC BAA-1237 / DSM 17374 / SPN1) TaxID=760011 RepID=F4GJ15_PARC1|nr:SDR family NAD(P)-dependent oxidoreductase [Parasphaerochaeta coccoides]AEC01310.1 3-oxoacyl-(acyl-carrier-protein) reductase [Parasphaerochaeta coccoides DSM 17374]